MRKKRIQEEREIEFMVDPQARFVSIVKRGANQIPFRIVKEQKGSESMKILQSLIVPKGTEESAVKEILGEDLEGIVKFDKSSERGNLVSYEQIPRASFKEDSFEMVTLDEEKSIVGIQGEMVEKNDNAIKRLFRGAQKTESVIELDSEAFKAEGEEVVTKQFSEAVYDEMYHMSNAIGGILSQKMGDGKAKIAAIKKVMANFVDFLGDVMAVTKGSAIEKAETPAEEKTKAAKQDSEPDVPSTDAGAVPGGGTDAEKDDPPPDVEEDTPSVNPVPETVKPDAELSARLDEISAMQRTSTESVTQALQDIRGEFEALSERVAKMQKMFPAKIEDRGSDEPVKKEDETPKEENVFRGTLFLAP